MADLHEQQGVGPGAPRPARKPLTPKIAEGHRRQELPGLSQSGVLDKTKPRKHFRLWFGAFGLVLTVALAGGGFIYLASESCESPRFRVNAEEVLSQQLLASVEIAPITANGLIFLRTPEIRVTGELGTWSVRLEQVSLEIARESFTSKVWRFRTCHAQVAHVDLGPVPDAAEISIEGNPSFASRLAQKLGLGSFGAPGAVLIPEFTAREFVVRGWREGAAEPGFRLQAPVRGAYKDGVLSFETAPGGTFDPGAEGDPWTLDAFAGVIDPAVGISIDAGRLTGDRDSVIELKHEGPDPGDRENLRFGIEFDQARMTAGSGKDLDPVLGALTATGGGDLRFPIGDPLDFQFIGAAKFDGLELSRSELFGLLADQTGEPRLRGLLSEQFTADIEWNAEKLQLNRVTFEAEDLARISGDVTLSNSKLSGQLRLKFPSGIISRIPGGKPAGFSYPASGWSQAQIQIAGDLADLNEDLSKRLLAEVAPAVTVSSAPKVETDAGPIETAPTPAETRTRQETLERLFFGLIEDDKESK